MTTQTFIADLKSDLQAITDIVNNRFIPLTIDQLNWKESAEQWSILECFEHLNRYNRYYNIALENAVARQHKPVSDQQYQARWLGKLFIGMMDPKNTKRQRTMKHLNPVNSALSTDTLHEFIRHQDHLLKILAEASQTNLNKRLVPVEFLRLLKMSIGDALKFVVVHQKRHLHQAERALQKQQRNHAELIV